MSSLCSLIIQVLRTLSPPLRRTKSKMHGILLPRSLRHKHNENHNKNNHDPNQHHQFSILPPHLPLQPATPHPKIRRPSTQPIRLIHQQINPLPPLQHPLDILRHDPPHIVDLLLRVRDRILFTPLGGPKRHHELFHLLVEVGRAVRGHLVKGSMVAFGVFGEELLFDFDEVAEGDAAAEAGGGDYEVGESAGGRGGRVFGRRVGDVVDEVVIVGVGQFLRGFVLDLGEDEGGERGGLRGGGGCVLR